MATLEHEAQEALSRLSRNDGIITENLDSLRDLTFALQYVLQVELGVGFDVVLGHVDRLRGLREEDAEDAVVRFLKGESPAPSSEPVPEDAVVFGG